MQVCRKTKRLKHFLRYLLDSFGTFSCIEICFQEKMTTHHWLSMLSKTETLLSQNISWCSDLISWLTQTQQWVIHVWPIMQDVAVQSKAMKQCKINFTTWRQLSWLFYNVLLWLSFYLTGCTTQPFCLTCHFPIAYLRQIIIPPTNWFQIHSFSTFHH